MVFSIRTYIHEQFTLKLFLGMVLQAFFSLFTSLRGWPQVIFSDPGSQLIGAERKLSAMWESMNKETTYRLCAQKGTK